MSEPEKIEDIPALITTIKEICGDCVAVESAVKYLADSYNGMDGKKRPLQKVNT